MTGKCKSVETDSVNYVNLKSSFSHRISRQQIQSRYGDPIDSLPIIIYIAEPRPPYNPIYVSQAIEIFGYAPEDFYNEPGFWISRIHEDDRERILEETRKAIPEQGAADYEYRFYTRTGAVRRFHDKGYFVRDKNGRLVSWEGFLLDVTERKNSVENRKVLMEKDENSAEQSRGGHILLVEDEEIIREMIRQILLAAGYRITAAENGFRALELCANTTFDLLITDLNMPQMNGRELAEKVRAADGAKKVLYISGFTDDDKFLQSLAEAEKYFLAKPFSPEALAAKVAEILDEN